MADTASPKDIAEYYYVILSAFILYPAAAAASISRDGLQEGAPRAEALLFDSKSSFINVIAAMFRKRAGPPSVAAQHRLPPVIAGFTLTNENPKD